MNLNPFRHAPDNVRLVTTETKKFPRVIFGDEKIRVVQLTEDSFRVEEYKKALIVDAMGATHESSAWVALTDVHSPKNTAEKHPLLRGDEALRAAFYRIVKSLAH